MQRPAKAVFLVNPASAGGATGKRWPEIARRAAEHAIDGCDYIYLTVDIDFIDTGFFPATGSVVNDAITPQMCLQVLQKLAEYPIGAMDIVEVSPRIDPSGRSVIMSTELLMGVVASKVLDVQPI